MSEKRQANYTWLLRKRGKKTLKIELFRASQWSDDHTNYSKFRIRLNGKWFGRPEEKMSFFYKYEFRDLLFRSWKPEKDLK